MLNLNYQPVYRTSIRYKIPVVFTIETGTNEYTNSLIEKSKKYYKTEMVFLFLSFRIHNNIYDNYYNTS